MTDHNTPHDDAASADDSALDRTIACLTGLTPAGDGFDAGTLGFPGGGVFGGQLLGQTIIAVSRLTPEQPVRSISASFPRVVADTGSIHYGIECLQLGNTYTTHQVKVRQPDRNGNERTGFSATLLSHRTGHGPEHHQPPPAGAGSPDDGRLLDNTMVPWELRVAGSTDIEDRVAQPAEYMVWTRVPQSLPDDGALHQALLAYVSDLMLIATALLPHDGLSQLDAHYNLRTAVVTHQVWFHRPLRIDDWLLLSCTSPTAAGGSGFGIGHVHNSAGELVASFAQESMIRFPDGGKL